MLSEAKAWSGQDTSLANTAQGEWLIMEDLAGLSCSHPLNCPEKQGKVLPGEAVNGDRALGALGVCPPQAYSPVRCCCSGAASLNPLPNRSRL